jgi:hypothetical protein
LTAPTAADIKKGGALDASALSGGKANIEGVFTWTNSDEKPKTSGKYSVTFTPNDTENYESVTFMIDVAVESGILTDIVGPIAVALILLAIAIIIVKVKRPKTRKPVAKTYVGETGAPATVEADVFGFARHPSAVSPQTDSLKISDKAPDNNELDVCVMKISESGYPQSERVRADIRERKG